MTSPTQTKLIQALDDLKEHQQFRRLPTLEHQGRYVKVDEGSSNKKLLNIASNDYLGLGSDAQLQVAFLDYIQSFPKDHPHLPKMGSTSSRLLTGNDHQLDALEAELEAWYQLGMKASDANTKLKSALVVNSGYHANIGLLPALTALPINTVILADKLVHASIIDGIRLSQSKRCLFKRYRHNDYEHLASLIQRIDTFMDVPVERIIIVTESIFSMDGDRADLRTLATLKATDSRIELYVDEAHAVGVLGNNGLGLAEETGTLAEIDYLIGTFGKAFASMGAYVFCDADIKQWLINQTRSFIFSTALPPINHCWTRFVLAKMVGLKPLRNHLAQVSIKVSQSIDPTIKTYQSPIIPYILGENARAVAKAKQLQDVGFYALPIRPPTVPINTARIRLVMNARLTMEDCDRLISQL